MTLTTIYTLIAILVAIDVIIMAAIFINRALEADRLVQSQKADDYFIERYVVGEDIKWHGRMCYLMDAYRRYFEQIIVNEEVKMAIYADFEKAGFIKRQLKILNCHSPLRRKTAISNLSYFSSPETKYALINRLKIEPRANVKIYIVNALKNQMDQLTLLAMIESVVNSKKYYQSRAIMIIKNYLLTTKVHVPDVFNRREPEIKELFVDLAESLYREDFRCALIKELVRIELHLEGELNPIYENMVPTRVKRLYYRILTVLSRVYEFSLNDDKYLKNDDLEVVKIAIEAYSKPRTFDQLKKLIAMANGSSIDNHLAEVIQSMVEANHELYLQLVDYVKAPITKAERELIANVLASKIHYLALRFKNSQEKGLSDVIELIIESGFNASLVAFLNMNRDVDLESMILKVMKPIADKNPAFYQDLNDYLDPSVFRKMGYTPVKTPRAPRAKSDIEISKVRWLKWILIMAILFFPALFSITKLSMVWGAPFGQWLETFVLMINNALIYYYLIVNAVYLILAYFSASGARKQRLLWKIKSKSMLYEKGILASISIIAPAFNEEKTIVESVTSLMNLKYPDYEVIVVNDGSIDQTLEKLIAHFRLERRNIPIKSLINTKAIKAVYKNKNIPNLIVVDKVNGGKADALNVGINTAKNEYVCGIDADSLLAPEALLKLMSSSLDHDEITLALGGNIYPVNGSTVSDGQVEIQAMSNQPLAAFQTIEYLRAFTLGRIGWSELKSLLIISGAFGLFEKRILAEVGGYLTASAFKKDTVGEDMELVVRITRQAYEKKLNFRVDYLYNAVCYTEVPEQMNSLIKQRNRWQRGLVDILSYHRAMIFNPKYHQSGMIAMPYYFLFEMVGPLIEVQGIAAVILSSILGLLSVEVLLLLMFSSVLLGITVSLLALLVTEKDMVYMNTKDTLKLVLLAIIENFGWRQFISMYRSVGYFASMKANQSWGTMKRKGFTKQ